MRGERRGHPPATEAATEARASSTIGRPVGETARSAWLRRGFLPSILMASNGPGTIRIFVSIFLRRRVPNSRRQGRHCPYGIRRLRRLGRPPFHLMTSREARNERDSGRPQRVDIDAQLPPVTLCGSPRAGPLRMYEGPARICFSVFAARPSTLRQSEQPKASSWGKWYSQFRHQKNPTSNPTTIIGPFRSVPDNRGHDQECKAVPGFQAGRRDRRGRAGRSPTTSSTTMRARLVFLPRLTIFSKGTLSRRSGAWENCTGWGSAA